MPRRKAWLQAPLSTLYTTFFHLTMMADLLHEILGSVRCPVVPTILRRMDPEIKNLDRHVRITTKKHLAILIDSPPLFHMKERQERNIQY